MSWWLTNRPDETLGFSELSSVLLDDHLAELNRIIEELRPKALAGPSPMTDAMERVIRSFETKVSYVHSIASDYESPEGGLSTLTRLVTISLRARGRG